MELENDELQTIENNNTNASFDVDKSNSNKIQTENDISILPITTHSTETERLNEIDVSVLAQPSINKAKQNAKNQKEKEIIEESENIIQETNINKQNKLPSTQLEERKTKNNNTDKIEKHIMIMDGQPKYDITNDLNNKFANITFSQLLDISPKLRAEFIKALRLKSPAINKKTPEEIILSVMARDDVATTECRINKVKGIAFLDTGASINIVTKQFLNKLGNIKPVGYVKNNIVQVLSKENVYTEIYLLNVNIGKLNLHDIFRVIDSKHNLFDILIGYGTLKDNNLFINPINNSLCLMKENNSWKCLTKLGKENNEDVINDDEEDESINTDDKSNSDINNNSYLYCFINENKNENNNKLLENHNEELNTINNNNRKLIIKLMKMKIKRRNYYKTL